jgi:hypothetical protein
MGTPTKYTPEQIALAKKMYMQYRSHKDIMSATGIGRQSLTHHIGTSWKNERELMKREVFDALAEGKRAAIAQITSDAIYSLQRFFREIASGESPLDARSAEKVSNILTNIDKIMRLDDGSPTEIVETINPATMKELKETLKEVDPFIEVEDADYREVKDDDAE